MKSKFSTHSEATRLFRAKLRHPANRITQVFLCPVEDNVLTIDMTETVDAEVRLYEYDDGVIIYEAIGRVDDVNGVEQMVIICVTSDSNEAREKIVEFYHRFM